ncbi:MAG: heparan-alpha-glucosaminide N-acetyltransferase domain-containing protein [Nonlabens sp.]
MESTQPQRLYFIDALRALAILLMLEGHFIDTLLDPIYHDSGTIYNVWKYLRGMTAPVFFTISGFIFTYLLLKAAGGTYEKQRLKKGLKRGLLLIFIGYLLRTPFLSWLFGDFDSRFFRVDVLQCIGLSLILIIFIFYLCRGRKILFLTLSLLVWIILFLSEPLYRELTLDRIPLIISNYLTKAHGSVFTIVPWFGYVTFGASLSSIFNLFENKRYFKWSCICVMLFLGIYLFRYSSFLFDEIFLYTSWEVFKSVAWYNYLFPRLADVLLLFAVFFALNQYLNIRIISKLGQKTLSIYVIHFIILYGSFTGLGLRQLIGKSLDPYQAGFGAILFTAVVSVISLAELHTNQFFYKRWKKLLHSIKSPQP